MGPSSQKLVISENYTTTNVLYSKENSVYTSRPVKVRSIAVCLFLCPLAYLKTHVKVSPHVSTCYQWPWLGPPLTMLCIHHILPVSWMSLCFYIVQRMGQNESRRVGFVQWWWHGGEVCRFWLHLVLT